MQEPYRFLAIRGSEALISEAARGSSDQLLECAAECVPPLRKASLAVDCMRHLLAPKGCLKGAESMSLLKHPSLSRVSSLSPKSQAQHGSSMCQAQQGQCALSMASKDSVPWCR